MVWSNKRLPRQSGFTLLEVIIALFLFAIGILGVAAMQVRAIQGNSSGMRLTEATAQAQDILETVMAEPYANFIVAAPPTTTTTTVGPYTITRNINTMPGASAFTFNDAIWVTVIVTWNEAAGNTRNTQISFIKSLNLETSYEPL